MNQSKVGSRKAIVNRQRKNEQERTAKCPNGEQNANTMRKNWAKATKVPIFYPSSVAFKKSRFTSANGEHNLAREAYNYLTNSFNMLLEHVERIYTVTRTIITTATGG